MSKIELLAPAGSMESAIAAVRCGADAIYLGFGNFNARRNAKNFSSDELREVISFARSRGVKTHITLNTLLNDRELTSLEKEVAFLTDVAPDAVIVADVGVARYISEASPDLCLHASTQLTVHSADGAQAARELGFSRVVLSRELSADAIAKICSTVDIECEVFVHGALCMCYSGQCYMSGFIGKRSGNRGLCAQPCRLPYRVDNAKIDSHPLSLRDLCLAGELASLEKLGVTSLKIEGRMKRPEYVAIVCDIYSRLLREKRKPTRDELLMLNEVFSRDGFTDGYFKNRRGAHMFGTRGDDVTGSSVYKNAQNLYCAENRCIPINFDCKIALDTPLELTVTDTCGNSHTVYGAVAERAITRPLSGDTVREKLCKTGGTPFYVNDIAIALDDGVSVSVSALNTLRREALDGLLAIRAAAPQLKKGAFIPPAKIANSKDLPKITMALRSRFQVSDALLKLPIDTIYLPPDEALNAEKINSLGVTVPQILWDEEKDVLREKLIALKSRGVTCALISNIGQIGFLKELGFTVHGDIGLNIFNSKALFEYKNLGLERATLSPELMLSQIRDISKCIPTEIVAYGHLPLMVTENCAISSGGKCLGFGEHLLKDRRGMKFPVFCLPRHRNLICNADVLYLADKLSDLKGLGIDALRLYFTNEGADDVLKITREYLNGGETPSYNFTRGLYYRGVE